MLNKKGFTIAEVIVSFSLVSVILASVVGSTVYYRDKVKQEELITQLVDFKNTITSNIYDDILTGGSKKITSVERCIGTANCINFVSGNSKRELKIIEYNETDSNHKRGVYLSYDGRLYMLPDSDLGVGDNRICDFVNGFEIKYYHDDTNKINLYTAKTSFKHKDLDKTYDIMVTLTNYDENN